jgi:signal transduction histidine kinase
MKLIGESLHFSSAKAPEGVSRAAVKLREAIGQLEGDLTSLLSFARLEDGAPDPVWSCIHVQDVFQHIAVQFEDVAEAAGVEITFRTTALSVESDRSALTRILENLVSNAIRFNRNGGRVLVAARRQGAAVRLEIWDQGSGIPVPAQAGVFRPFYQAAHYRARRDGVGLGLAIVARLAASIGATLTLRSIEGKGSVFKVTLIKE